MEPTLVVLSCAIVDPVDPPVTVVNADPDLAYTPEIAHGTPAAHFKGVMVRSDQVVGSQMVNNLACRIGNQFHIAPKDGSGHMEIPLIANPMGHNIITYEGVGVKTIHDRFLHGPIPRWAGESRPATSFQP